VQTTLKFTPRPERKRGFFKASSLVNTYENAVHFHDGRFTELSEVVDYFDALLSLGLSTDDRDALVEYLKTL
jgi:cytochrome c peroxidase